MLKVIEHKSAHVFSPEEKHIKNVSHRLHPQRSILCWRQPLAKVLTSLNRKSHFLTSAIVLLSELRDDLSLKATSHSTIFDIPMHPLREDQKHRHRFTRLRRPATPVMVIIPLNIARCTLPTHRNC